MSEEKDQRIQNMNMQIENNEQQIIEQENASQFSQDFKSEQQQQVEINKQDMNVIQTIPKVTNPVSAYSVFMKQWRLKHPQQKMNMSAIGQIWKQLDSHEKQIYERKFGEQKQKYQQYVAQMLAIDPNFAVRNKGTGSNYFFPLHRVRGIMKQDNFYTTSAENVTTMTKAVQYFGQYFLQQVKKVAEGKKRIDGSDLFQAINNNQNTLWFLNCLIDEHNLENDSPNKTGSTDNKKIKISSSVYDKQIEAEVQQEKAQIINKTQKAERNSKKSKEGIAKLGKGQIKLTDMF